MDFVSDALADGRRFRCFTIVDDMTRECQAIEVSNSLPALRVIQVLDRLALTEVFRGASSATTGLSSRAGHSISGLITTASHFNSSDWGSRWESRLRMRSSKALTGDSGKNA